MASGKKVGRTAHENVRDQARELAAHYRLFYECPDEEYCVNPDDLPEEQVFVTPRQALGYLLDQLENFAETGQFGTQIDMKRFSMREEARMLKKQGMPRTQIIEKLMQSYLVSQSVVERAIRQQASRNQSEFGLD
jgi:hypothetical protein